MKPLLGIFALSIYLVVCCGSFLEWDPNGNLIAHSYSVWGDWSAHFTFIENMRQRGLHWLAGDNPVFAGAPFQYPFLSHLITAGFGAVLGMSTITVTEWTSLLLLFFAPFFVYRVYKQFGLKPVTAFASTAMFFLVGGYQWMGLINSDSFKATDPLTNQFDAGSVFTQFVCFEFYPQRAFLFGLMMLTGFGFMALKALEAGKFTRKTAIITGLGFSLLALTHVHSYIAIAAFLIFYFVFKRDCKTFIYSLAIAVLGCASLAFLLLRNRVPEFSLSWDFWLPGWATNSQTGLKTASTMNPILFWVLNTGLYLPMAWTGFWFANKDTESYPLARTWFGAGMFLFVLANIFNLQPYWYDNLKTFTYAFFFFAPFIGVLFEKLIPMHKTMYAVVLAAFGAQIWSGTADLNFLRTKHQGTTFFNAYEFSIAEEFKHLRNSPDDLVLFSQRHNHWVTCLAGSPVVMGFTGWLWSWGISYGARELEVNEMLLGGTRALELLKKLNVGYVVLNAGDRVGQNPVNLDFFRTHFSRVLNRDGWEIFAVRSPSTSVR
ncbi:MAG: hypothetical protein JST80_12265 [Bdellovibrionales bacterium]|nr:hypothetical protein [Bdellovibrionales bacterium]